MKLMILYSRETENTKQKSNLHQKYFLLLSRQLKTTKSTLSEIVGPFN